MHICCICSGIHNCWYTYSSISVYARMRGVIERIVWALKILYSIDSADSVLSVLMKYDFTLRKFNVPFQCRFKISVPMIVASGYNRHSRTLHAKLSNVPIRSHLFTFFQLSSISAAISEVSACLGGTIWNARSDNLSSIIVHVLPMPCRLLQLNLVYYTVFCSFSFLISLFLTRLRLVTLHHCRE